ncbi:transglycosylase SLT domain-containing protein [Rubellimicrobium aerolatum]|uniref:transglycosylase SLT domain-containing protein n=1 Tax=Rubellimicrobium aerolatum TaxID=490979 RepID=UPI0031583512|nr:hypothetical protein [Rubellimicrobium aerolatum]
MARWTLGGTFAVIAGLAAAAEPLAPKAAPVVPAAFAPALRPEARPVFTAEARWDGKGQGAAWSVAAMKAVEAAPRDLREMVPADIGQWCPGYERAPAHLRAAFWVGTVSALARYESNFDPRAQGGGGAWQGLLQISPATARHHGCEATSAEALRDGEANLQCAIRIMSRTVARDGVVAADGGGIAADWGPMASAEKRESIRDWVSGQSYCERSGAVHAALRPEARPEVEAPGVVAKAPAHRSVTLAMR